MSTSEIVNICQQLASEGKEPSVALIKARLTQTLPLPMIIAGLKSYKANPKQTLVEQRTKAPTKASTSLEQRVKQLETELFVLKKTIPQLQSSSAA